MELQKVRFQRIKLVMFAISHARKSLSANSNEEAEAHKTLVQLCHLGVKMRSEGKTEEFIIMLDRMALLRDDTSILEKMIDGTYEDLPPWLQK